MMPILNGISDLTYLVIALFGGLQVLAGRLTVGNMQAFVQYVLADQPTDSKLNPIGRAATKC